MTRVLLGFAALFLVLLLAVRLIYGGGQPYAAPALDNDPAAAAVRVAFEYAEPIGGLAIDAGGTLFFTVHPASRPVGNKLLRLDDGVAAPFPDGAAQQSLLTQPLAIALDARRQLWVLDQGRTGRQPPRLLAFDADTGERTYTHEFDRDVVPVGAYPGALAVTDDGATVFVADTSILRKAPALIVHDTASGTSRRVLEDAPPLASQGYRIDARGRTMSFFGGLFSLRPGLAGIALDADEAWLYLAASTNDGLYRVATEMLTDPSVGAATLAGAIERYSDKPLSDGVAVATDGVIVADVERAALVRVGDDRRPRAWPTVDGLRWPGPIALAPDGAVWFGDTGLSVWLFGDAERVAAAAPYRIYRTAAPGP